MQCVSSIKKLFPVNKKIANEEREPTKHKNILEVYDDKLVSREIARYVEDVKSTLSRILSASAKLRKQQLSSDHKRLNEKLCALVRHLRIYRNHKSKNDLIIDEIIQSCEELISHLKNMCYLNNRNSRAAEMMIENTLWSKKFEEKKKKICMEVESALQQRISHKWSILKNSNNKQQLEKFLNEITVQKKAIKSRQKRAQTILAMWRADSIKTDDGVYTSEGENDDPDGSFGSTMVCTASLAGPGSLVAFSPSAVYSGRDDDAQNSHSATTTTTTTAGSGWFPDVDLSLMYEQEAAAAEMDRW